MDGRAHRAAAGRAGAAGRLGAAADRVRLGRAAAGRTGDRRAGAAGRRRGAAVVHVRGDRRDAGPARLHAAVLRRAAGHLDDGPRLARGRARRRRRRGRRRGRRARRAGRLHGADEGLRGRRRAAGRRLGRRARGPAPGPPGGHPGRRPCVLDELREGGLRGREWRRAGRCPPRRSTGCGRRWTGCARCRWRRPRPSPRSTCSTISTCWWPGGGRSPRSTPQLAAVDGVRPQRVADGDAHAWVHWVARFGGVDRDRLAAELDRLGVGTKPYYAPAAALARLGSVRGADRVAAGHRRARPRGARAADVLGVVTSQAERVTMAVLAVLTAARR